MNQSPPNQSPARGIAAILLGLVVAIIIVLITVSIGHMIFPPPAGLDMSNPEHQTRLMEQIPTGAKVAVVLAWFLGSLAGAATAIAIGRKVLAGWIVALLIGAMGVWTTQMFPHPLWMVVGALFVPLIAVLVVKRLMADRLATY